MQPLVRSVSNIASCVATVAAVHGNTNIISNTAVHVSIIHYNVQNILCSKIGTC